MLDNIVTFYCRSLPRFRGKQRGLKVMKSLPCEFGRSYYGPRMAWNPTDSTYRACMVGAYGRFISEVIASQDQPFTFLDIGSNQGLYALCASANPNCERVFAFEPNPATFAYLARNIEANGRRDLVTAFNAAIAETPSVELSVPDQHSGAASMFGTGTRITVPSVSSDDMARAFDSSRGSRIIAKIDVEGAETIVLGVLKNLGFLQKIDMIIIEISSNIRGEHHGSEIVAFLNKEGWSERQRSDGSTIFDAVFERD